MELLGEMEGSIMGGRNHTKLTESNVAFIRRKASEGMTDRDIHTAWFAHLDILTIKRARMGETWAHVCEQPVQHEGESITGSNTARREALIHALSVLDTRIDRALLQGFARNSSYVEGLRENRRKLTAEQIDLEDTMRKRGEL